MTWMRLALITIASGVDVAHRLVLCRRLAPSSLYLSRNLAAGRRNQVHRPDRSTTIPHLCSLCLCHLAAGYSFGDQCGQTGSRRVAARTSAADTHGCRLHQAPPRFCDLVRDWLAGKAANHRARHLVPPLTASRHFAFPDRILFASTCIVLPEKRLCPTTNPST